MKRSFVVALAALALLASSPAAESAVRKPPPLFKMTISNFRYCKAAGCNPQDYGYVRGPSGPIAGTDHLVIKVKSGSLLRWYYRDELCETIGCPGHNVYFEKGATGRRIGSVPSGHGARTISYLLTQKRGTTIRYFCTVSNHYLFGMTGIIKVT